MPTPAVSLKMKKFRRRFGIAAPRVIVRSHLGWPWYAGAAGGVVLVLVLTAWFFMQRGENGVLYREIDGLQQRLREADDELTRLRARQGTEHNAAQMERTAQEQLRVRVKTLEAENAGLREERVLLEKLLKDCRKSSPGRH